MSKVFDDRICALGEGPLWHPLRQQLYWFDILGKRLLTRHDDAKHEWQFDEHVSAAGWVDHDTLLMASETGLWRFSLETGARDLITPLEADNPVTRSNDGRADPWGGFWIGSMGKNSEKFAGAIHRFYKGKVRTLFREITVSNAICFAPDRSCAYFTDTHSRQVMRQELDADDGWPTGAPSVFLDLRKDGLNPDGAVIDAAGNMWVAQWGASRVAVYSPQGAFIKAVDIDAEQASCPAFGGADFSTLYVTTAAVGLHAGPHNGLTFVAENTGVGLPEYQVIL
jgi:sugar lactone lactonase YvrE